MTPIPDLSKLTPEEIRRLDNQTWKQGLIALCQRILLERFPEVFRSRVTGEPSDASRGVVVSLEPDMNPEQMPKQPAQFLDR